MLLNNVYLSAYGGTDEDVKFIIRPTPRIEVNSVEVSILCLCVSWMLHLTPSE